jgi:TetR/AcrR family transcriptional regulator
MITPTPSPVRGVGLPASRHRLSSEDRRQQLLEQAVALFSRHGFSGTRTKDIAAACSVSEAILFRHFASKEDLYQAILATYKNGAGADEWIATLKQLAAARDDEALIQSVLRHVFASFRQDPAFHRLMLYARLDGHALADLVREQMGVPVFGILREYIARRQREGVFRAGDPGAMALFLVSSAWQQATYKYVFGADDLKLPDEERIEQLSAMILSGLRAPRRASGNKPKSSRKKVSSL